jgi:WD repeat-containing protein 23
MSHNEDSQTERSGDERPETVSIGEILRSTYSRSHRSIRHLLSEIAIVQIRAMGTDHVGEDNATSPGQGLLQRLLSPGSFRLSRVQGDRPTTPRRASEDSSVEDGDPGIRDNDEEEEEDYEMEYSYWGRPFARTPKWFPAVTAPQEAGLKLLMGGEFGRVGVESRSRKGSANFSKAILSSRSKLRQTPRQDITNVRGAYMLRFLLS